MANTLNEKVTRYEAPQKVSGDATYAADFMPSGLLHGWLVTSPIAVGTVTSIDTSAALAAEGVLAVYTHETIPNYQTPKGFYSGGPGTASFWPMTSNEIKYAGQPIAYIVAETAAAARHGAQLVEARFSESDGAIHMDPSQSELAPGDGMEATKGDVESGLANASATVEASYSTPFQHHNAMEMFSATAEWNGNRVRLWMPSQSVRTARAGVAKAFGLPETDIEVICPYVGGAFGSKAGLPPYAMLTIAVARDMRAPVRLIVTRANMYTVASFRAETVQRIRMSADESGKLTAFEHIEIAQTSRFDSVINPGTHMTRAMYACPNIHTEQRLAASDTNTPGFMRAPNEMQTFFALESAIDELANQLDMDPVELRRVNDTQRHPLEDVPFSSRALMQCYDAVSDSFGWANRATTPGERTDGDWIIGYGCATSTYPTGVAPSAARVRVQDTGTALVELAAHDVGTGAYTIMGQIAAARLGLDVDRVSVVMGQSDLPIAPLSGGSVTSASAGSAVHVACQNVADEIVKTVVELEDNPLSGSDPADVTLQDGMLVSTNGQQMKLIDALKATPRGEATAHGEYAHPDITEKALRTTYQGGYGVAGPVTKNRAMFAFGAQMVEVRIHKWTKEIRVPRIHGAFAAGKILNRKTAHSQLMGGMIWGIGSALHEHTEVDVKRARFLNTNIAEYLVPVNADIAEVNVEMLDEDDDYVNPLGVKGIGELGIVGTAAAIANAVYNATGKRIRKLPITISDVV
jgi:xanthine dehydrogenase YagR molybdenum-binding subunit